MEHIDSLSSDYAKIFQDISSSEANEIKKSAMLSQLNTKVAVSEMTAQEIATSLIDDEYQMDSVIPENSTVSYHI